MHGPIAARRFSRRAPVATSASIVAQAMLATVPRQPAWEAATRPSPSLKRSGRSRRCRCRRRCPARWRRGHRRPLCDGRRRSPVGGEHARAVDLMRGQQAIDGEAALGREPAAVLDDLLWRVTPAGTEVERGVPTGRNSPLPRRETVADTVEDWRSEAPHRRHASTPVGLPRASVPVEEQGIPDRF